MLAEGGGGCPAGIFFLTQGHPKEPKDAAKDRDPDADTPGAHRRPLGCDGSGGIRRRGGHFGGPAATRPLLYIVLAT